MKEEETNKKMPKVKTRRFEKPLDPKYFLGFWAFLTKLFDFTNLR